jgi:hypothetical protein
VPKGQGATRRERRSRSSRRTTPARGRYRQFYQVGADDELDGVVSLPPLLEPELLRVTPLPLLLSPLLLLLLVLPLPELLLVALAKGGASRTVAGCGAGGARGADRSCSDRERDSYARRLSSWMRRALL